MARMRQPMIATPEEARLAREASEVLEAQDAGSEGLRVEVAETGGQTRTLDLPAAAVKLLRQLLKEMGAGNAVALVPVEAEITTQEAADLLNVSRPYVVGLIAKGELPARMVGNQRRLPLQDVLAYKAELHAKRLEVMEELTALDQELGLR